MRLVIYYVNVGFTTLFVLEAIIKIAILTPPVCVLLLCVGAEREGGHRYSGSGFFVMLRLSL